jgi:hypothetical protein
MSEKRAIDLAYEIIWGTSPLKNVHKALGEIIARENAELLKLRDTAPVTGDAAWFQRYSANVKAMAAKAGYVGEEPLAPQRDAGLNDIGTYALSKGMLNSAHEVRLKNADAERRVVLKIEKRMKPFSVERSSGTPEQAKAAGFGFVEPDALQRAHEASLHRAEAERRCKTPRYELEAVDDKRQAKRGPVKIDEATKDLTWTSGAEKGSRVAMIDWRKPFTNAYRPKLSRYDVKMKVVDKQEQHGVVWLKCEFPLESGEKVRRWFPDDGRLILWGMYTTASHAKT